MISRNALRILPIPFACVSMLLVGCGGSEQAANIVSGKVTHKGNVVAGRVTFTAGAGKEVMAPINPDGTYNITNPPLGQVKILVQSLPGVTGAPVPPGAKGDLPGAKAMATGVPPPPKYATAAGGLTYEVKAGKHTHDIDLP